MSDLVKILVTNAIFPLHKGLSLWSLPRGKQETATSAVPLKQHLAVVLSIQSKEALLLLLRRQWLWHHMQMHDDDVYQNWTRINYIERKCTIFHENSILIVSFFDDILSSQKSCKSQVELRRCVLQNTCCLMLPALASSCCCRRSKRLYRCSSFVIVKAPAKESTFSLLLITHSFWFPALFFAIVVRVHYSCCDRNNEWFFNIFQR